MTHESKASTPLLFIKRPMPFADDEHLMFSSVHFSSAGQPTRWPRGRRLALRRLEAARGYLDLDMPRHALDELDGLDSEFQFQVNRLRGEAFCDLERHDEALECFTQALNTCPNSLPIMMGIATCYQRQDQLDQAVLVLEDANRLHPLEPAILFSLARCAALQMDIDGALTWLGRAMRICPDVAVWAETDPEFALLRTLPDFVWFVEMAKRRVNT